MSDITLQQLLEAGCHFGHKAERRHPKATPFIYTEKDGIHIIDLVQTKAGLDKAIAQVREIVGNGGEVLFVGTKRQAKDVLKTEADRAGVPFVVERWIGGFLTNWEGIQRTIKKILTMTEDQKTGAWKRFPKHEQVKMAHHLKRMNMFYGGVTKLMELPKALFIVDVKKEGVAFRETIRCHIPIIAIVDTNVNPTDVQYPIPANDDAVGSIAIISKALADAYLEGKRIVEKNTPVTKPEKAEIKETEEKTEKKEHTEKKETIEKKEIEEKTEKKEKTGKKETVKIEKKPSIEVQNKEK